MREELPEGWINIALPQVAELIMGQSPPSTTYNTSGTGLPFFQGKAEFGNLYPTPEKYCDTPGKIAEPGDVLISVRAPVGPTNLCQVQSCIGRGLAAIRPRGEIPSKYLLNFFRNIEPWLSQQGTGSTFTAISKGDLQEIEVPLAPLPEQRRIVAKLEALLAKVDASRKRLERIPTILKRFRQAVLAAACDGRLTEDWRIARSQAVQTVDSHNSASEDLPQSWQWQAVDSVCERIVDCPHSTPAWADHGRICIRTTNFRPGLLDLSEVRYVSEDTFIRRNERLAPRAGDVLFSREGGILGIACLVPENVSLCLGQRMMLLRTKQHLDSRWLMHWLNAPAVQRIVAELTGGTAAPHLNVKDIKEFSVPVLPPEEQQEILRRLDQLMSFADGIEARYTNAKTQVDRLTQSILAKAFRGELVPQDPNDEPATVLLSRLAAAPSEAPTPARRRGRPPRVQPAAPPVAPAIPRQ